VTRTCMALRTLDWPSSLVSALGVMSTGCSMRDAIGERLAAPEHTVPVSVSCTARRDSQMCELPGYRVGMRGHSPIICERRCASRANSG